MASFHMQRPVYVSGSTSCTHTQNFLLSLLACTVRRFVGLFITTATRVHPQETWHNAVSENGVGAPPSMPASCIVHRAAVQWRRDFCTHSTESDDSVFVLVQRTKYLGCNICTICVFLCTLHKSGGGCFPPYRVVPYSASQQEPKPSPGARVHLYKSVGMGGWWW